MNTLSFPISQELRSAVELAKRESDPSAAFSILVDRVLDLAMQTDCSLVIPKDEIRDWFFEDERGAELIDADFMDGLLAERIDEIARRQGDTMERM